MFSLLSLLYLIPYIPLFELSMYFFFNIIVCCTRGQNMYILIIFKINPRKCENCVLKLNQTEKKTLCSCKAFKLHRVIALIELKNPIDFGVGRSKVKVTVTRRVKTVSAQ